MQFSSNNLIHFGAKTCALALGVQSLVNVSKGFLGSKIFESLQNPSIKRTSHTDTVAQRLQYMAQGCLYAVAAFALYSYDSNLKQDLSNCHNNFTTSTSNLNLCNTDLTAAKTIINQLQSNVAHLNHQLKGYETTINELKTNITAKSSEITQCNLAAQILNSTVSEKGLIIANLSESLTTQTNINEQKKKEFETQLAQMQKQYLNSEENLAAAKQLAQGHELEKLACKQSLEESKQSYLKLEEQQSYRIGNLTLTIDELTQQNLQVSQNYTQLADEKKGFQKALQECKQNLDHCSSKPKEQSPSPSSNGNP